MIVDFHIHPDFSIDSSGSIEDYCHAAKKKGISQICFTTHLNLVPQRISLDGFIRCHGIIQPISRQWINHYIQSIEAAKLLFDHSELEIFSGVEIDYHPAIEKTIAEMIQGVPLDFVLGAVHSIDGYSIAVPEDCRILFRQYSAEELCEVYYHLVIDALHSGLFDAIAHLDLYKRFSYPIYGQRINTAHRGIWNSVLDAFSDTKTAVEINTGNWRKGLSFPSPSLDLLIDLKNIGITGATVGSDAHHPELVGCDIRKAYQFASSAGFQEVLRFRNRQPEAIAIFDSST